jgi:hypothetical protein
MFTNCSNKYMTVAVCGQLMSRDQLKWVTSTTTVKQGKNTGKRAKLFEIEGGYKEFRELHGRRTDIVDFTFSPQSLNFEPGTYIYEVGVKTTGDVPRVYRQGTFTLRGSPAAQGVAAVNWTTNVNWSAITWQNLPDFEERYYAALRRHLNAHRQGALLDPESKELHLSHALCNIAFLVWRVRKEKDGG